MLVRICKIKHKTICPKFAGARTLTNRNKCLKSSFSIANCKCADVITVHSVI